MQPLSSVQEDAAALLSVIGAAASIRSLGLGSSGKDIHTPERATILQSFAIFRCFLGFLGAFYDMIKVDKRQALTGRQQGPLTGCHLSNPVEKSRFFQILLFMVVQSSRF